MKYSLLIAFCVVSFCTTAQSNYLKEGHVNFALSSHQDMAWMDVPDKCTEFRIEKLLMPSLRMLEKDSSYCFTMEYALTLEEFLNKYPERKDELMQLTAKKRLDWGATFNQPYEGMLSGESLIRETYLGKRWLQKQFPGCEFVTAFNPDVPGRSLQTSQIHAKAGIKYGIISRFEPGIYQWFSLDGSSILCKSNGIYCDYARTLAGKKEKEEKKEYIRSIVHFWDPYYKENKMPSELFFLHTDDNEEPYDYQQIFKELSAEKDMPEFGYTTISTAMDKLVSKKSKPTRLEGEWPDLWLYIHNPTHHEAVSMMRDAQRNLVNVEKFGAVRGLLTGSFASYPQDKLNEAWKCAIYPDHGWGGNGGYITDEIYKEKFRQSQASANEMLEDVLGEIGGMIEHKQEGLPIVVFNPESWLRNDIVITKVNVYGLGRGHFVLTDDKGQHIPFQYLPIKGQTKDGDIQIAFQADSIPSIGYRSYYLKHVKDEIFEDAVTASNKIDIDNPYYRISFAAGGIKSIFDKRLNRELLRTDKFLGGEVFCTRSVGNGAGEFKEIQPITMEGFEKSSDYSPSWSIIESGRVREVRECRSKFKHATVIQRIIAYQNFPKIDIEIDLEGFTGEAYQEFRMTMPLNQSSSLISYEVPMGVVEIGKNDLSISAGHAGGLHYTTPLNETPLRECQNWFASSDDLSNVMLSSSVGVFGYKDATSNPVDYPVLQPVLLASRKSCHWKGNWYLQQGNHSYRFSLHSSDGDWKKTHQLGTQSAQPLLTAVGVKNGNNKILSPLQSFFSVDKKNVMVSTIKKCEDDDNVVVRLFDIEGMDSDVSLWSFKPIKKSCQTNIIEEPQKLIDNKGDILPVKIGHHSIETYKLEYK